MTQKNSAVMPLYLASHYRGSGSPPHQLHSRQSEQVTEHDAHKERKGCCGAFRASNREECKVSRKLDMPECSGPLHTTSYAGYSQCRVAARNGGEGGEAEQGP